MTGMVERLEMLLESRTRHHQILLEKDKREDLRGSTTSSLMGSHRFIGVAEYVLNHDINTFRSNLTKSAKLQNSLIIRYDAGEPIAPSYVTMIVYQELLDALAAGDLRLAREFAGNMGGREKIEKELDHPFDRTLGYTLKSFVSNDKTGMELWSKEFLDLCRRKKYVSDIGYANMFKAILEENEQDANKALAEIAKGHKRLSRGSGRFSDTEDEVLCVWGLGMANLARMYGLKVESNDPLIPADLLIEVRK